MEVTTMMTTAATPERLGNDSLQFKKVNSVSSASRCPEVINASFETKPFTNSSINNNNHHHGDDDDDDNHMTEIKQALDSLLAQVELEDYSVITATTSQASTFDSCTKVSLTPVKVEDEEEVSKSKDIVLLRNLEITPPPQDFVAKSTPSPNPSKDIENSTAKKRRSTKRTHSEQSDGESAISGRSKRQRRQTELFQVQAQSVQKTNSTRKPTKPDTPQVKQTELLHPDVIFYRKGEHLAIRNEDNNFYLCQLTESVRKEKQFVKILWLDTQDEGKTYFLTSHYDKIPHKSIIMPVVLDKLKTDKKSKQFYTISDSYRSSVIERLNKSINIPAE